MYVVMGFLEQTKGTVRVYWKDKEENYQRFVYKIIESDLWPENGIIHDFM